MAPLLEMRGIVRTFGALRANDGIDLDVQPGQILGLLGENGSGKSTLMKVLFGMLPPDAGTIIFRGRELSRHHPREAMAAGIAMIHQHFMLIEAMTVVENVMLGWQQAGRVMRTAAIAAQVREASRRFGLHLDPTALVATLPLGRRQRVEILKAILRDAELLILDEPTSNLAPTEIADLLTILRRLRAEGKGIIFITHKLPEVLEICDEVVVLRDGRVSGRAPVAGASRARLAEMMVGRDLTRAHKPASAYTGWRALIGQRSCRAGIWLFDVGRAGWGNSRRRRRRRQRADRVDRHTGRAASRAGGQDRARWARYHACAGRRAGAGGPGLYSGRSRLDRAGARDVRCRKSDAARQRQLPLCPRSVPHPAFRPRPRRES